MITNRKMPRRIDLGRSVTSTVAQSMGQRKEWLQNPNEINPHGLRTIMGFCLPSWQRGLVWSQDQKISFIESAWLGVPLGTYSYNQAEIGHPLDNLLIDGQQRMSAIEGYLNDDFPVFGCLWSEVTEVDRRRWSMTVVFASYITTTEDEEYLRGYYDLLNFGGTPHSIEDRRKNARAISESPSSSLQEQTANIGKEGE